MCVVRVVSDAAEEVSEVPTTASNVRKDLTEWQEKHATFVLTTVKVSSCFSISFNFDSTQYEHSV